MSPVTCLAGEGHPDGGDSWIEKSGPTEEDLLEWDQGGDVEVCFKSSSVGTRSRGVEKLHRDDHQESPPTRWHNMMSSVAGKSRQKL